MTNRWTNATDEQKQRFKEAVSRWKKKAWKILSKEEKARHIRQLKINAEKWRKNKSEESKRKFKEKMSNVMKERWKDNKYKEFKRRQISEQMKIQWDSYTEEEKEAKIQDIKDKAKAYRESPTKEEREEYTDKMYQWRIAAAEEREKRGEIKRACQFPECLSWAKAISKINLKRKQILIDNGFSPEMEHPLWDYCYDFKIWDTLIEINPYAYHNSTRAPKIPWAKVKDKMYHYNKAKNAIDRWYKLIMVRDRTTVDFVIDCLKSKTTFVLWGPNLHRYNIKTKEHILDEWFDREEMISKWYVEIYDCWF